jgi:hypothetical protein
MKRIGIVFILILVAAGLAGCGSTMTVDYSDPQSVAKGIVAKLENNNFSQLANFFTKEYIEKEEKKLVGMKAFLALAKADIKTDDDRRMFDILNNMTVSDLLWFSAGGWSTELVAKQRHKTYTVKSAQLVSVMPDKYNKNTYISCIKMDVKWSDGVAETFTGGVRLTKNKDGKYYIGVANNLLNNMPECQQATQR